MKNILLYSDNVYSQLTLTNILDEIFLREYKIPSTAIFMFEKNWLDDYESYALLTCKADLILVLCRAELLHFISVISLKNNILYSHYDAPLKDIKKDVHRIFKLATAEIKSVRLNPRACQLTPMETQVTMMTLQGIQPERMAGLLNKHYKTINSHKRNAMKKMGVATDMQLMQKRRLFMIMSAQQYTSL